jgi:hypothetical protein
MNRDKYPTFMEWWIANEEEYRALSNAEDGDPFPLADLIEAKGEIATKEARAFVASRLKGEKKKRGGKRTIAQQAKEIGIFWMVRDIQKELNCGEHTARMVFLERHSDICSNDDSLNTYLKRAKKNLKQMVVRKTRPKVQETDNPEPE